MQDETSSLDAVTNQVVSSVSWEASEYEHHDKDFTWSLLLVAVTTFLSVLTYFVLRDVLSVLVIVLMAVAVGLYGYRKPRTLNYQVGDDGVRVAGRGYPYDGFKSFSIVEDGSMKSVVLEPLQRLLPPISMYYSPDDEGKITEILGSYLPYKQHKSDFIERLFKRLRF